MGTKAGLTNTIADGRGSSHKSEEGRKPIRFRPNDCIAHCYDTTHFICRQVRSQLKGLTLVLQMGVEELQIGLGRLNPVLLTKEAVSLIGEY